MDPKQKPNPIWSLAEVGEVARPVLWIAGSLLVYVATGWAGPSVLRWWAALATAALPIVAWLTYRLATHAAQEHIAGFHRGLDGSREAVETIGRAFTSTLTAMARPARSTTVAPVHPPDDEDLLAFPRQVRIADAAPDQSQTVILG